MNYRRIKAIAILVLFLTAGVLYSVSRSQDIFVYDNGLSDGEEMSAWNGSEVYSDTEEDCSSETVLSGGDIAGSSGLEQGSGSEQSDGEPAQQSASGAFIHVHVCGAVKNAGVYLLPENSIVEDAIREAGGVLKGGAADYLNLAGTISEGDKIYVPFLEDVEEPCGVVLQPSSGSGAQTGQGGGDSTGSSADALVNINTADSTLLMTLPGIGQTRADAIIAYRETNGSFQKIEDIMKVSGIKEGAFGRIKDRITV